jgi:predicted transcriptional regulator
MPIIDESQYLAHYGILRKSGRYPWGSGGARDTSKYARALGFFEQVAAYREQGFSDVEIAQAFSTPDNPFTTTMLRDATSLAKAVKTSEEIAEVVKLKEKNYSNVAIAEKLGIPEPTVRNRLKAYEADKTNILEATSEMLRREVAEKGIVEVGKGTEFYVGGISKERLRAARAILLDEGYALHDVQVPQLGTTKLTNYKVLCPPGTTYKDIVSDPTFPANIRSVVKQTEDGGRTWYGILPPMPLSSDRIKINYEEDGGDKADGVIYVRPGVKDVDLGGSSYAQVRIDIDGTHYMKGMAVYRNDLPEGVDVVFNTNKAKKDIGTNKLDALKAQKDDKDNPFGAVIRRQIGIKNEKGEVVELTSVVNILDEEGSWDKWSRNLASQTLSKQSPQLAQKQLDVTFNRKREQLEEIKSLTNPAVKAKLLDTFADSTDKSAVHLEAAAIPRSSWHVLLPIQSLKQNEVYAPNFTNGERVALIRYPHGGKFEIPELTVNNSNREGRSILGPQAKDAVGIHPEVAKRLSGADFDGDTVLVIPNDSGAIKSAPALEGLKNFDPQRMYPGYEGMKTMAGGKIVNGKEVFPKGPDGKEKLPSGKTKAIEMGKISNLITDMTLQGANSSELADAVRHSMVVIDAEKHRLDYRRSERENRISALKARYQIQPDGKVGGSSTLLSRAESPVRIRARKPRPYGKGDEKGGPIDQATGKLMFVNKGDEWVDKKGNVRFPTEEVSRLAITDDARDLISTANTRMEHVYANHSNRLKAMANEARKEMLNTPSIKIDPSAKRVYAEEVKSLKAKLNVALQNSPRERQAQVLGNTIINTKKAANPNMPPDVLRREKAQALDEARRRMGAKKVPVVIEPREWEAIQAGAITQKMLKDILDNTDINKVKELATPKPKAAISGAQKQQATNMARNGYSQQEIAEALGVSLTALKKGLDGDE